MCLRTLPVRSRSLKRRRRYKIVRRRPRFAMPEVDRVLFHPVIFTLKPVGPVPLLHIEVLKFAAAPSPAVRKRRRPRSEIHKKARDKKSYCECNQKRNDPFNYPNTAHVHTPCFSIVRQSAGLGLTPPHIIVYF